MTAYGPTSSVHVGDLTDLAFTGSLIATGKRRCYCSNSRFCFKICYLQFCTLSCQEISRSSAGKGSSSTTTRRWSIYVSVPPAPALSRFPDLPA
eukprot:SAG11_NODE_600_length_8259_cov_6.574510_2_plen_94_part_00